MFFDFKKSSPYAQHQLNAMLKSFKNFVKIYIDDIMMFSKMFNEHLEHFAKIFQFFKNHNISMFFIKSFFSFFDIILLKQRVNSFEMNIMKNKIKIIFAFSFFMILKELNYFLNLIN